MMRKTRTPNSPRITQLRPPKGAPNVLIVLIDDAGFGPSSALGGPCYTPTAERLAAGGLPAGKHVQLNSYYEHENNTGKTPNEQRNEIGFALNLYVSLEKK
jgi:hypothetical protein